MKGRKLQMERAAFVVLQAPRFVRDAEEEEALLTDLSQAGLSNPSLSWVGLCSLIPTGTDPNAYFSDLRDRVFDDQTRWAPSPCISRAITRVKPIYFRPLILVHGS